MANNYKTIRVKRNGTLFRSNEEALAFLNRIPHVLGQPVMVTYQLTDTEVDTMFALGTSSGIGPTHYRLVSSSGIQVVSGIIGSSAELPDSSTLVNGQTFIYKEPATGHLYWIYLDNTNRVDKPIDSSVYYKVFDLSDNTEYWVYNGEIEKTNNYYSRERMDSMLATLKSGLQDEIGAVEDTLHEVTGSIRDSLGVDSDYAYPGTIEGAESFDQADSVLNDKIIGNLGKINVLNKKVEDLENELMTTDKGMSGETRLDKVYTWFDTETHRPSYSVTFERLDEDPLVVGTTHTYTATFKWSWADRAGLTGFRLNSVAKRFGEGGVLDAGIADGMYVWNFEWTIPILNGATADWTACFTNATIGTVPVEFEQKAIEIKKDIKINYPEGAWKSRGSSFKAPVVFTGTGMPSTWSGNEMSVKENGVKAFSKIQTAASSQIVTYNSYLDTSKATTITASWGEVSGKYVFYPVIYSILPKGTQLTLDNVLTCGKYGYYKDNNFEIPTETYTAGQTLVIMSPRPFVGHSIAFSHSTQTWHDISADFCDPVDFQWLGTNYQWIVFESVGAGTFNYKIQQ